MDPVPGRESGSGARQAIVVPQKRKKVRNFVSRSLDPDPDPAFFVSGVTTCQQKIGLFLLITF
jgi:hypothetical protein